MQQETKILGADGKPAQKTGVVSAKEARKKIEDGKDLEKMLSPEQEVAEKIDPEKAAKAGKATYALKAVKAIMDAVDDLLKEKKLSRQIRKAFWKNFYEKGEFREDVFAELIEKEDLIDTLNELV